VKALDGKSSSYSPSTRRRRSSRISPAMLVDDSFTSSANLSSANGACGRQALQEPRRNWLRANAVSNVTVCNVA